MTSNPFDKIFPNPSNTTGPFQQDPFGSLLNPFRHRGARVPIRRPVTEETAEEEPAEAMPAEEPVQENPAVTLSNLKWECEMGVFNAAAGLSLEVSLPEELKNQNRISLTLFALPPDGSRERIDSQEAYVKDGKVEARFTCYYPQYREDGKLLEECEFLFQAKHRDSKDMDSPSLEVVKPSAFVFSC